MGDGGRTNGDLGMSMISVQDAQARLADLIRGLSPGQVVTITENDQPVARLARTEPNDYWPCKAGSARGKIWMAPDFEAPLEEFEEYME
jgi:antitoxin (DNA-binding transcriptional repressor) of toxin-antitoxin stability system